MILTVDNQSVFSEGVMKINEEILNHLQGITAEE